MTDQLYQLNYDLDGTSYAVRENLVDILERELLGPTHGPEEVLPFSPRSHYLVGHIAPVGLDRQSAPDRRSAADQQEIDDVVVEERGDIFETELDDGAGVVGVQVVPTDDHYVDDRDDDQQDRGPQRGLMIPSSMGLRFQIPQDLDTFIVTASWGTYASVATEEVTRSGPQDSALSAHSHGRCRAHRSG